MYLPEALEMRLDAEAAASGTSKAELIRKAIAMLLDSSSRAPKSRPLPVFDSGRVRSPEEMDDSVYAHIKERNARR